MIEIGDNVATVIIIATLAVTVLAAMLIGRRKPPHITKEQARAAINEAVREVIDRPSMNSNGPTEHVHPGTRT